MCLNLHRTNTGDRTKGEEPSYHQNSRSQSLSSLRSVGKACTSLKCRVYIQADVLLFLSFSLPVLQLSHTIISDLVNTSACSSSPLFSLWLPSWPRPRPTQQATFSPLQGSHLPHNSISAPNSAAAQLAVSMHSPTVRALVASKVAARDIFMYIPLPSVPL